jgi:hypothetical protein
MLCDPSPANAEILPGRIATFAALQRANRSAINGFLHSFIKKLAATKTAQAGFFLALKFATKCFTGVTRLFHRA